MKFTLLRYQLHTTNAFEQERALTEKIEMHRAVAYRYLMFYSFLVYYPDFPGGFSQYLCRKHEDLSPDAVSILHYDRLSVGPAAILAGTRPESQLELINELTFACREPG